MIYNLFPKFHARYEGFSFYHPRKSDKGADIDLTYHFCWPYSIFQISKIYFYYSDIDECSDDNLNSCDDNALCSNSAGSYSCSCNSGFIGDGRNCVGLYSWCS